MFSGIVQSTAKIASIEHGALLTKYSIDVPLPLIKGVTIGASVSVNGACQTVVAINGTLLSFDAISETLRCTTIKSYKIGQIVNVERSLKMGDEVGGHLLSGHIIGTGTISNIIKTSAQQLLTITCQKEWMKYILFKGYIALHGVSLTVQEVYPDGRFTVHLIPETLRITTFAETIEGNEVNIEIDSQTQAIVDTVERVLAAKMS